MVMRKKISKWLIVLALILLPTLAFGVNRIYLSNIDGTAPTTLPVPGDGGGTLLTISGQRWSAEGSLFGSGRNLTSPNERFFKSPDGGITWNQQSTTSCCSYGVFNTGSSILGIRKASGTTTIRRTIDEGVNWTSVYTLAGDNTGDYSHQFFKSGSSIWSIVPGTNAHASNLIYSDDDGVTWNTQNSGVTTCDNIAGITKTGSIIVIGSMYTAASPCTVAPRGGIVSSIDSGVTFNYTRPDCDGVGDAPNGTSYSTPILISGTIYITCKNGSTPNAGIFKSTDGITWSFVISWPYTPQAGMSDGYLGQFFDNQNYYLYLLTSDASDSGYTKVWRSPIISPAWTLVYNTNLSRTRGNFLTASNNKIYFGLGSATNGEFYRLD